MTNTTDQQTIAALTLRLEARAENVMLVRQAIEGATRGMGVGGQLLDDIKLAVTEACSNVVRYAYGDAAGRMTISVEEGDGTVNVRISDSGNWRPPPPNPDAEPSGMGIPIMEAVTVRHEIYRRPEGTEVLLVFGLDGRGG